MTQIDARGLKCPWPALRLLRAAREAGDAVDVTIVADDPAAAGELGALASARGWTITRRGDEFRVFSASR